jgi:2-polyprenyl-3-methyl-5-hydroxy-6-metoxy-1,4-benzoquinol methylase
VSRTGEKIDEMIVNKNIIEENLEAYARYLTEYRNCIICGSNEYDTWATFGSYRAVKCKKCGLIWINPHLSKEGLERYYQDYIGMRMKSEIKTKQREIQYEIDKNFIESWISCGRVLDVGCSGGFFLNVLNDSFEKYGIDIDREAVEYARRNFPFGENIKCCSLEEVEFPEGYFDLVVMRGVIEHLTDPKSAVKKVSEILRAGGFFYIAATPNADSFCAELYREKWNLFHPVRHIYYFSERTLSMMCSQFKLRLVCSYYPYVGTPYANIERDMEEVFRAWRAKKEGRWEKIDRSPSFWGNMMNLIFRKS